MERRTKIVATLGPATAGRGKLERLLRAGVDVVRLNLSHGSIEEHRATVRRVRQTSARLGRHIAVLLDLMGPRYRVGPMAEPRLLRRGQKVVLGPNDLAGTAVDVPIDDPVLIGHLGKGERLLLDNGLIELEVLSRRGQKIWARVVAGGQVSSRKGINLPDSHLPFEIGERDELGIALAIEVEADFLAASYVGEAADVEAIRHRLRAAGPGTEDIPIVAKLERGRAVKHLEEIVEAAEAVMVARGDLGVEIPLHQVPVVQKRIIEVGWRLGRPVIVATQMLESMMEHPRPTRAESSDVANAVFDGADAMMLSGETAAGAYPVEAVRTMRRIIVEAEAHLRRKDRSLSRKDEGLGFLSHGPYDLEPPSRPGGEVIPETISAAAVLSARQLGARRIVALIQGGLTVRMLAGRRPSVPVVAFTLSEATARRVQLVWGVRPLIMRDEVHHHDEVVERVDRRLLETGLAAPGDVIVIVMGDPIRDRPPTNLMRIHRVRSQGAGRDPKQGGKT